ncbi:SEC-C domain-containing protein [Bacillus thuringiensis serovar sumiyoshiensis]|uniref:YecA family protein n=1 Tax=Bacillus thuringiensis TaxID=1428 RepID=UPI000A3B7AF9|nr:SEC-C domain-containing protein [Bacillus thuringiensis]OTW78621.1 hypothetical protein BK710_26990 [Bacillus thuringiensis serovar sumiyoshiensis]
MLISKKEAAIYSFKPYEECPCESGKKYKFCCYEKGKSFNKEKLKYTPGRIIFEAQKMFRETDFETCFAFNKDECSTSIIGAHSLQNNGVLDKIATDNHVYHLTDEISNNLPTLQFTKIGKNQASKFNGFCKYHDKYYFSCIEDEKYIGTEEQNFWFAFRAFCFELHRKERFSRNFPKLFEKHPYATREVQVQLKYKTCKLDLKDKEIEYARFRDIYENSSYNKLESFMRVVPYRVGFTGTTAVAVNVDISGKKAADIYNYDEKIFIPSLYISVIPRENTSLIIVSRHVDDICYKDLMKKLRETQNDELLFKYISFCLAEYSENVYFSPTLIDKLSSSEKKIIIAAFGSSLNADPSIRLHSLLKGFKLNLFNLR